MEVVDIKKILVPNLLIYIYLHCVRSSLWCATMLATLSVMSVRHMFIKMLGIESIHSKVAINHSALFTASDNFRIIMNKLRQKKGKTSFSSGFLARMLLEIGLLFSIRKSYAPISWLDLHQPSIPTSYISTWYIGMCSRLIVEYIRPFDSWDEVLA